MKKRQSLERSVLSLSIKRQRTDRMSINLSKYWEKDLTPNEIEAFSELASSLSLDTTRNISHVSHAFHEGLSLISDNIQNSTISPLSRF